MFIDSLYFAGFPYAVLYGVKGQGGPMQGEAADWLEIQMFLICVPAFPWL